MVREKTESEKERGKSGKSHGILTGCPNLEVLPLLKFKLITVSAKMLYQEVMENSLRSGRSPRKVRENESRKGVATRCKITPYYTGWPLSWKSGKSQGN